MKQVADSDKNPEFDAERMAEFVLAMNISSHKMSMPLYMLFWVADWLYVPNLVWIFLPLRAAIIPFNLLLKRHLRKISTLRQAEVTALIHSFVNGFLISIMIFIIGDPGTLYYAGLNLVGMGAINFFPWRGVLIPVVFVAVYGPYLVYGAFLCLRHPQAPTGFCDELFLYCWYLFSYSSCKRSCQRQHRPESERPGSQRAARAQYEFATAARGPRDGEQPLRPRRAPGNWTSPL